MHEIPTETCISNIQASLLLIPGLIKASLLVVEFMLTALPGVRSTGGDTVNQMHNYHVSTLFKIMFQSFSLLQFLFDSFTKISLNSVLSLSICQNPEERRSESSSVMNVCSQQLGFIAVVSDLQTF